MQPKQDKQQLAKDLYFQTDKTQLQIAEILDVNRKTVYLWIKNGRWEEMKIAMRQAPGMILQNIYNHIDQINLKIKGRDPDDRCPSMEEVNKMQKLLKMTNDIAGQHTGAYMEAYEELLKYIIKKDRALGRQVAVIANEYVSGFLKRKEFYLDEQEMENIEQVTKNLEEDKQEQKESAHIIPFIPSEKEDGKCAQSPSPSKCLPEQDIQASVSIEGKGTQSPSPSERAGERSTASEDTPSPSECLSGHERSSGVRPKTEQDIQASVSVDGKGTPSPSPLERAGERSTPDMPNSKFPIPNSNQKEPVIQSPASTPNGAMCGNDEAITSPSDICPKPATAKDYTEDIHTPIPHNTQKENVSENACLPIGTGTLVSEDGKCAPSPSPSECLPGHERSSGERSLPRQDTPAQNSNQKEPLIQSPASTPNGAMCGNDEAITSPSDICPKPAIAKDPTEDIHSPMPHITPQENFKENACLPIGTGTLVSEDGKGTPSPSPSECLPGHERSSGERSTPGMPNSQLQIPNSNKQEEKTAAYYASLPPSERPSPFREGNTLWVNDIEDINDDERKMSDIVRRYPDMDPYLNKTPYQDPFKKTEEEKAKMAKAIADRKAITDKCMNENIFREYKDVAQVMSTNIYDKVNIKGKDVNKMWFQYNLKQMELPSEKRELLTETEFLRRHSLEATLKYMRRAG